MSRCFPFPPPGYEKKSRAEDADLLKKEKSKEKKHKKEKKEKEKREGKEKRDKDKSDEKRREKKEKKKDKDKDKDRDKKKDRDKEKESRPSGKTGNQNGEAVVRVKHNSVEDEKHTAQLDSCIGNKISQNAFFPKETKNSKTVQEVGRRIEDGGAAKLGKLAVAQPKKDDRMATQMARNSETMFEGMEHNKNKKIDERNYNGQGIRHEERFSGNSTIPSSTTTATATVESGVAEMVKQLDKSAERKKEANDKIGPKEGEEKRGSKHKDKDKEKKGRRDDKEKKKEKKAKKAEAKNAMVDKTKEISKDNVLGRLSTNTNTSQLADSNIGAAVEENLIKKRKDFEANGVLHEIDNRPSKLSRPASHPLKENGRILEPGSISPSPPPSERQALGNDVILVGKERKINGVIDAHHPPASSKHKSGGQDDHPQPTATPKRSPHPDSKLLSQVYSVPKMEELSDSDNQDWLFSSSKPKLEASAMAEDTSQVWAEAMQIDSVDVFALPYVIPY
ncbi:hypothetical protein SDJN03_25486, partial [Cucurbita argyrosperma subsp. sororia]